jgi:hypothetical protein
MDRTKARQLRIALAVMVIFGSVASAAQGEVTFYIQRERSLDDHGEELFVQHVLEQVGSYAEQDFEDPALGSESTALPTLPVGDFVLQLSTISFGQPSTPWLFTIGDINAEGRINSVVLVSGSSLTITPSPDQLVLAIGAWIFDDYREVDSVFLAQVTELNGDTWQVILENEIDATNAHEIEGFVGAVSDIGFAEMKITAVDPQTGEPHDDVFEIDYLKVAGDPFPPQEPCSDPDDQDCPNGKSKKPKNRPHPLVDPHPGEWAPDHQGPNQYAPGYLQSQDRRRSRRDPPDE